MAQAAAAAKTAASAGPSKTVMSADHTEGAFQRRCFNVFQDFDTTANGSISATELKSALENMGMVLPLRELRKLMAELDTDGNGSLNFTEFCDFVKMGSVKDAKFRNKNFRFPRLYMPPDMYDQYAAIFAERAGPDGQMAAEELDRFFKAYNMNVPQERLHAIMAEVDDDQSGYLDEAEFMGVVIKAAGMKKRKVGPGLCTLASLQEEGWINSEIRKVGYEAKDLLDIACTVSDLMEVCSAVELKKAGVTTSEIVSCGWDCVGARQSGFELAELLRCGCSMSRIRRAGWDDLSSAVQLRTLGVDAHRMKAGGWTCSELRAAGFSVASLRQAGFSTLALAALPRVMARQEGRSNPERKNTLQIRQEVDKLGAAASGAAPAGSETEQRQSAN